MHPKCFIVYEPTPCMHILHPCAAAPGPACLHKALWISGDPDGRNAAERVQSLTSKNASVLGGCCCCRRRCPPVHSAPGRLNARRACGLGLWLRVHGEDIHYYREPSCPSHCCWPFFSHPTSESEGRSQSACWLVGLEGR